MTTTLSHAAPDTSAAARPPITSLSIVLPCFDEEQNVVRAIAEAASAAREVTDRYEVVVVDDGSADDTRVLAEAIARGDEHVRVVAHEANRGYGAAVRSGLRAARMDWILLTDGDLQFDLSEIADIAPLTPEADVLAGFRIMRMDPLNRRVNAAAWNWLVRRVLGIALRDVDCAFKLLRRDVARNLDLTAEGAMVSTELIMKARAQGARIVEVGVHHRPRPAGRSSGASPRVIARAFRELARIAREQRASGARAHGGQPQHPAPSF